MPTRPAPARGAGPRKPGRRPRLAYREIGTFRPDRPGLRSDAGIWSYEGALRRAGFGLVAGADEAGRGACAGPLVVAACVLPASARVRLDGLGDSKMIPEPERERLYGLITRRALAWSAVIIPSTEIDDWGLHVANLAGMRRAVGQLSPAPDYVLTDGFPVTGLGHPGSAVWKGDAVAACVAAASIIAKVTRDRIMHGLHEQWPQYEFTRHKGYITPEHTDALTRHGPCAEHRRRYVNVRRAMDGRTVVSTTRTGDSFVSGGVVSGGVVGDGVVGDNDTELLDLPSQESA